MTIVRIGKRTGSATTGTIDHRTGAGKTAAPPLMRRAQRRSVWGRSRRRALTMRARAADVLGMLALWAAGTARAASLMLHATLGRCIGGQNRIERAAAAADARSGKAEQRQGGGGDQKQLFHRSLQFSEDAMCADSSKPSSAATSEIDVNASRTARRVPKACSLARGLSPGLQTAGYRWESVWKSGMENAAESASPANATIHRSLPSRHQAARTPRTAGSPDVRAGATRFGPQRKPSCR